jgi:hypothetical protein
VKSILLAALLAAATLLTTTRANAIATWDGCYNWAGCRVLVTVDSGTAKSCKSTGCGCQDYGGGGCPVAEVASTSGCSAGYTNMGLSSTGTKRCCVNTALCFAPGEGENLAVQKIQILNPRCHQRA